MTTSYYLEYLQKKLPFAEIEKERKRCLTNLSDIRDRDVIVYAANFKKPSAIVSDDFYFIKRNFEDNWIINNQDWIEKYPEFSNKYFNDVMPFYAGGMLVRNGSAFFSELLDHCQKIADHC